MFQHNWESVVEECEAYRNAKDFLSNSVAVQGVNYKWVADYAKYLWEDYNNDYSAMDEKAESIVKYLGGATGLLIIGVLFKVDAANSYIAISTIPAVICSLIAIGLALMAKQPAPFPRLPSIQQTKTYSDYHKEESPAVGAFLGQWNLACETARLICDCKAGLLKKTMIAAFSSLVLLLVPLVVAICLAGCSGGDKQVGTPRPNKDDSTGEKSPEEWQYAEAKVKMKKIENAIFLFRLRGDGDQPADLSALARPHHGKEAALENKDDLIDPWGQPFTLTKEMSKTGVPKIVSQGAPGKNNPVSNW
jgi:Type II secretion system (T2SS), protein G